MEVRWDQRRARNGNGKDICKCLNYKTSNRRKHIIRRTLNRYNVEKWMELTQERVRMRLWYWWCCVDFTSRGCYNSNQLAKFQYHLAA